MASAITSAITNSQFLDSVCYQLSWTGSPTGTFSVQVSLDHAQSDTGTVLNAGTWTDVTLSYLSGGTIVTATTIPTSVGSPVFIDLALLTSPWVRVKYTASSGSGTLVAYVSAKALG